MVGRGDILADVFPQVELIAGQLEEQGADELGDHALGGGAFGALQASGSPGVVPRAEARTRS